MRNFYLAIAAFVLLSVSSAFGQYLAVAPACSQDVTAFCNAARSERNQLSECIKTRFEEFSAPCKTALVNIFDVRKACKKDIDDRCPKAHTGSGRLLLCFRQHYSALSESCRDAIGHAALKRHK